MRRVVPLFVRCPAGWFVLLAAVNRRFVVFAESHTLTRAQITLARPPPAAPKAAVPDPSFCACPNVCATTSLHQFYNSTTTQMDRIGTYNLAVMEFNTVYRLDDILRHHGDYYRRDTVSILCDPAFRGTLLRSVLRNTTLIHGKPVPNNMPEEDLEAVVGATGEGAGPGYAFAGGLTGPSGIELAPEEEQLEKYYYELRARYQLGRCETSAPDELVVPLRLGDLRSDAASVRSRIDATLEKYECHERRIRKAVVMGVLHYGFNVSIARSYFTTHLAHARKRLTSRISENAWGFTRVPLPDSY